MLQVADERLDFLFTSQLDYLLLQQHSSSTLLAVSCVGLRQHHILEALQYLLYCTSTQYGVQYLLYLEATGSHGGRVWAWMAPTQC